MLSNVMRVATSASLTTRVAIVIARSVPRSRNLSPQHAAEANITDFRFHDLRHTFGTRLADAGVDVVKIKELMGHASIVTTMRYIHATDQGKRARLWCCQSIGNSIVASLSQANSVTLFHPL
jgi:hypothetical protein